MRGGGVTNEKLWYDKMITKSCAWLDYCMVQNIFNRKSRIVGEAERNVPENMRPKILRSSLPYAQHSDGLLRYKVKQR